MAAMIASSAMGYLTASVVAAPFTVLGVSLQLSISGNATVYGPASTAPSLVKLAQSKELAVKEMSYNALQLRAGMTGTNTPFKCPVYANYREAFMATLAQGYQGFYKGNFVGLTHHAFSIGGKIWLSDALGFTQMPLLQAGFCTWMLSLGINMALYPIVNCQTRFILQNRMSHFATYRSLYVFLMRSANARELYQGVGTVLPITIMQTLGVLTYRRKEPWQNKATKAMGVYLLYYPLITVQRRIMAQSEKHTMLPRRYPTARYAVSNIYHTEGIFKGFYRGVFANTAALALMYSIAAPTTRFIAKIFDERRNAEIMMRSFK